jgi:hypothetical protein
MKERAKEIREGRVVELVAKREFMYEKGELMKVIRKVLLNALSEQETIHTFYRDWLTIRAFFEVLTSVKEQIALIRQRRDIEERVLATFVLFAIRGRRMVNQNGNSYIQRNIVQSVM